MPDDAKFIRTEQFVRSGQTYVAYSLCEVIPHESSSNRVSASCQRLVEIPAQEILSMSRCLQSEPLLNAGVGLAEVLGGMVIIAPTVGTSAAVVAAGATSILKGMWDLLGVGPGASGARRSQLLFNEEVASQESVLIIPSHVSADGLRRTLSRRLRLSAANCDVKGEDRSVASRTGTRILIEGSKARILFEGLESRDAVLAK